MINGNAIVNQETSKNSFEFVSSVPTVRLVETFKQHFTFTHTGFTSAIKYSTIRVDEAEIGNHFYRIVQNITYYNLIATGTIEAVGHNQSIVRGTVEAIGEPVPSLLFAVFFAVISVLFAFIEGNFILLSGILLPILTVLAVNRDKYFRRRTLLTSIEQIIRQLEQNT